ncbi:MAG: carboxypeptidase-like regulatory domain-containing protein [Acidobacteriota bacterium]
MTQSCMILAALLTIALGRPTPAGAQSIFGSMTGNVVDPSGAVIAGAEVTATNAGTGAARRVKSDSLGAFVVANLEPAVYEVKVQVTGFKTHTKQSVSLPASERLALGNIVLEVGSQAESITVRSEGATVQTASAERSGLITSTQVDALLIKSRSIYSMLALMPGIQDEREEEQPTFVWAILSNGGRQTTTDISLDGISTVNMIENRSSTVDVSMDSVAEVKVLAGIYQAEYGRMAGANVQLVSKSGTRDFHGLVSFFKRHEQFNANNYFYNRNKLPKPRYRFNSWNYNAGGPVYIPKLFNKNREKLFFFWSQEFWPTTQSSTGYYTVPTQPERNGDFSQSLDLNGRLIEVLDPATRQPMPGNRIPLSRINKSGQALLNVFPEANFFDLGISARRYNYVLDRPSDRKYLDQTLKVNYNLNSNHMFSTNWSMRRDPRSGYFGLIHYTSNTWAQMPVNETNLGFTVASRYHAIFSPTLLNEVSVGISRQLMKTFATEEQMKSNRRDVVGFTAGQIDPVNNPLNLMPDATFGGISSPISLGVDYRFPEILSQPQFQLNDTLTKIFPTHTIKAGVMLAHMWADETGYTYYRGRLNYGTNVNNPLDSRHPFANGLFGVYDSYVEESKMPRYHPRIPSLEWFLQDTWKVTRRLTLDYGVRFHWMPFPYEKNGFISGWVAERWQAGKAPLLVQPVSVGGRRVGRNPVTGETLPTTLIGALVPGSGDPFNGLVSPSSDKSYPRGLVENRPIMLGPRFGFAYDVFGNGKTAVRGGGGILYNRPFGYDVVRSLVMQAPQVVTQTLYFGYVDNIASSKGYSFPVSVYGMDRTAKIPTTYNFSVSIQQNVGYGTVLDVAYVGSLSRHLEWWMHNNEVPLGANFRQENADPGSPSTPLPANFLRPMLGYINVLNYEWNGSSNYHSLQVQANRRFATGLQFGVSWTWSKTMAPNTWDREAISRLVGFNSWYRGLSGNDRTHMLKANWVYELPKMPGTLGANLITRQVFNGWQISGIASFLSGQPTGLSWSSTVPADTTGSPSLGARIDYVRDPVLPKSERTFARNFITEVFRRPAVGTVGNTPKYYLRRPGVNNWDIALFKNFVIREPGTRIQLRWEMYNAFNHTQFSAFDTGARFDPQGNQVNAQFGAYTAARNPRIMQVSLRFYF